MLTKKIIENLKNGNYRIEYREKCDCDFYWYQDGDSAACQCVDNGGCWFDNALIMDDLAGQSDDKLSVGSDGVIATYDVYYGVTIRITCWDIVIVDKILQLILDSDVSFKIRTGLNTFRTKNELHERRKIKSLLELISSMFNIDKFNINK